MQPDSDLVLSFLAGNQKSFETLVLRYYQPLQGLLQKWTKNVEDAEDLTQEAILAAKSRITTLREPAKFKSWLFVIGMNLLRNDFRSRRSSKMVDLDEVQLTSDFDLEEGIMNAQCEEIIIDFGITLPYRQRQAFLMRLIHEKSYKEIAHLMDCPYDTAKANYRHALEKFRIEMKKNKKAGFTQPCLNFEAPYK